MVLLRGPWDLVATFNGLRTFLVLRVADMRPVRQATSGAESPNMGK